MCCTPHNPGQYILFYTNAVVISVAEFEQNVASCESGWRLPKIEGNPLDNYIIPILLSIQLQMIPYDSASHTY